MLNVSVRTVADNLVVQWQMASIKIPMKDIIDVRQTEQNNYQGSKKLIRIGSYSGTESCLQITTYSLCYRLQCPHLDEIEGMVVTSMRERVERR
ncbi:hypothetical protein HXA31_15235 [Salipaludibacillus agaradhaerens]|uniref:Sublancin immunity protein SunI-like PH domain-containing protein n=1 Tax=Salipaludibacillus agaradhaerens TaxID=76935 RepID=A0A9Q4FZE6_SALAG|nr:hypothetical protein [Salipaludibacillus agaradhaerens]MCR6098715.1 hypothetical protein [Salipaludibacillus agaradhaerens]MCR6115722.1 hypothetical protein [Salipaludibacillus agaradhaerens]